MTQNDRFAAAITKANQNGYAAGYLDARVEVLNFLEEKYMSKDVERGDHTAAAILKLAREISNLLGGKK